MDTLANSAAQLSKEELEKSFSVFTDLASNLHVAYQELEVRVKDLTERLQYESTAKMNELEEKQKITSRYHKILTMLPTAVIVIDGKGIVTESNTSAMELLGMNVDHQRWVDVIQSHFAPKDDDGCEVSLANGKRVSITTKPLSHEPGQIVVMYDLTQTRKLQEQLAIDKQLKEMGKLIASLAHQIRTPLATALLYCDHLIDASLSEAQHKQFAEKIKSRLANIEEQISDMLSCAKGNDLHYRLVSVDEIVRAIQTVTTEKLTANHAVFYVKNEVVEAYCRCHLTSLVGAFSNLINNAIEARESGLVLRLHIERSVNDMLSMTLSDNGPGISREILNKITEPFFTTHEKGTGLGLAIVKNTIQGHHGSMRIESTPGEGTTFIIDIPECTTTCGAI